MITFIRAALLIGTVAAAAPACSATRSFPVGGFDRILSKGPIDVHVRTGSAVSVRATGPDATIDRLDIAVRDGQLVVGLRPGRWWSGWSRGGRTIVDVTVPRLSGVGLNGPGDMTVDRGSGPRFAARVAGPGDLTIGSVEADAVALTLNGPGDLRIEGGRARTADYVLNGPGNIHAAKLAVRDATIVLRGPGDIDATVSGSATGSLAGPGDITIEGGARCSIRRSGPGDVFCR